MAPMDSHQCSWVYGERQWSGQSSSRVTNIARIFACVELTLEIFRLDYRVHLGDVLLVPSVTMQLRIHRAEHDRPSSSISMLLPARTMYRQWDRIRFLHANFAGWRGVRESERVTTTECAGGSIRRDRGLHIAWPREFQAAASRYCTVDNAPIIALNAYHSYAHSGTEFKPPFSYPLSSRGAQIIGDDASLLHRFVFLVLFFHSPTPPA